MKRLTVLAGIILGIGITASTVILSTEPTQGTVNRDTAAAITAGSGYSGGIVSSLFDADSFVKPTDSELRESLSPIEYKVTQQEGTERPFSSPLNDEKRTGIYVDIVSGEPLFSSSDKFDSGTGWPSFMRPLSEKVVIEKVDRSLFGKRTEIRSTLADSHLGHVFNDGPAPTGNRYCMNAAAMRFIPLEKMAELGYGAYIERVSESGVSG